MENIIVTITMCPQADDLYTPSLVKLLLKKYDRVIVQRYWGDLGRYNQFGKRVLIDVRPKFSYSWKVSSGKWKGWYFWQLIAIEALDAGLGIYPYSLCIKGL